MIIFELSYLSYTSILSSSLGITSILDLGFIISLPF